MPFTVLCLGHDAVPEVLKTLCTLDSLEGMLSKGQQPEKYGAPQVVPRTESPSHSSSFSRKLSRM
jgi:hypothetical protein